MKCVKNMIFFVDIHPLYLCQNYVDGVTQFGLDTNVFLLYIANYFVSFKSGQLHFA